MPTLATGIPEPGQRHRARTMVGSMCGSGLARESRRWRDGCFSRPPAFPRQNKAGFTLVEMLVVMVILGILATAVSLSVGVGDGDTARREAERLAALLEFAADESRWRGSSLGFALAAPGYHFLQQQVDGQWAPLGGDDTLRPRPLPAGLRLDSLTLDRRPLPADSLIPFSAGIAPLFQMRLASDQENWQIASQPDGRVLASRQLP